MGTLGEPFATPEFVRGAFELGQVPGVEFVELVTNGSLLERRLPALVEEFPVSRVSFWVTFHKKQTSWARFLGNVEAARDLGFPLVVNILYFEGQPLEDVQRQVEILKQLDIPVNVDPGYLPNSSGGTYGTSDSLIHSVSTSSTKTFWSAARSLGVSDEYLGVLKNALDAPLGAACFAGGTSLFIGIDGRVYPCSRYYELGVSEIGEINDDRVSSWTPVQVSAPCKAAIGCANKEDFLNRSEAKAIPKANRSLAVAACGGPR